MTLRISGKAMKALAMAAALSLAAASVAEARTGGGRSFGSRGSNSYSAPPSTNTAPRTTAPLPGPGMQAPRPGMPASPAARQPSRWGGFLGGLGAGLLGAGLMGMLFGGGFLNGIGSFMGFLGLMLQIGLIAFAVMFAIRWFRNRNKPAMAAGPSDAYQREAQQPDWRPNAAAGLGGASAAGMAPQAAPQQNVQTQPLELQAADYDRFERMLTEVQVSYGAGDRIALTRLTTPEMANELNAELTELARQGVVNKLSDVKLLQGDLSEAWSEPGSEYATVAMRYAIVDAMIDKASGRVVDGDAKTPQQVVELWTFRREPGEGPQGWALSAIQQA